MKKYKISELSKECSMSIIYNGDTIYECKNARGLFGCIIGCDYNNFKTFKIRRITSQIIRKLI